MRFALVAQWFEYAGLAACRQRLNKLRSCAVEPIEVNSRLPDCPLTDPGVRNYRTGLFKTARVAPGNYMIPREHEGCAV